jgi:hypothetical protein
MAAGTRPPFETAVRDYFCPCLIRLFIFVKSKKKYKKNPVAVAAVRKELRNPARAVLKNGSRRERARRRQLGAPRAEAEVPACRLDGLMLPALASSLSLTSDPLKWPPNGRQVRRSSSPTHPFFFLNSRSCFVCCLLMDCLCFT